MCFSERSPRRIKAEFLQQPGLAMIGKLLSAEMAEEKTRGIWLNKARAAICRGPEFKPPRANHDVAMRV